MQMTTKKRKKKKKRKNIPGGVELNDDEVVLGNNVREVGIVQGNDKLLGLSLFSVDLKERSRE